MTEELKDKPRGFKMPKNCIFTEGQAEKILTAYNDLESFFNITNEDVLKAYFQGHKAASVRLGKVLRRSKHLLNLLLWTDDMFKAVRMKEKKHYKIYTREDDDVVLGENKYGKYTVKDYNTSQYNFCIIHDDIIALIQALYDFYKHPQITAGFYVDTTRLHKRIMGAHAFGRAIEIHKTNEVMPISQFIKKMRSKGFRFYIIKRNSHISIIRGTELRQKGRYMKDRSLDRNIIMKSVTEAYDNEYTWARRGHIY